MEGDETMFREQMICAALVAAAAVSQVACSKSEGAAPGQGGVASAPAAGAPASGAGGAGEVVSAKELFGQRCAPCHGAAGKGDGAAAANLMPKPRNYTDKVWQKGVTDEQLKKVILYGGAAIGKSPIMPGNPDLDGKPEVVAGLVSIIRDYGK
jgi:mono/diheme cytochrome c family protein